MFSLDATILGLTAQQRPNYTVYTPAVVLLGMCRKEG